MYSRSYYPESQERINLPGNYDGTAFMERQEEPSSDSPKEVLFTENEQSEGEQQVFRHTDDRGSFLSDLGRSPLLSGIFGKDGLLGGLGLSMPSIGTEEILIIATAAFLFFSKSGDRECALILLLLLFIN